VAGSFEYGNDPSGCIKGGEFLDKLNEEVASQKGLWSVEFACKIGMQTFVQSGAVHGWPQHGRLCVSYCVLMYYCFRRVSTDLVAVSEGCMSHSFRGRLYMVVGSVLRHRVLHGVKL
jgi:hypothetical protein